MERGAFNGFDAAVCDPRFRGEAAASFDLAAFVPPVFAARGFVAFGERTLACFAVADLREVLEDFLRVFLDIRLPFDAFGGSTNRVLRVLSWEVGFAPAAGQV
jgi:hypothetical protein